MVEAAATTSLPCSRAGALKHLRGDKKHQIRYLPDPVALLAAEILARLGQDHGAEELHSMLVAAADRLEAAFQDRPGSSCAPSVQDVEALIGKLAALLHAYAQRIETALVADAEDVLYAQAVAALGRGDQDAAVPLLRHAAEKAIGDAAWLLAVLLDERGETAEAITWYERAARDGDSRADAALSARYAPSAVLVRDDPFALDAIAHGAISDYSCSAEEASRSGSQPSARVFVTYSRRDTDFDFYWLPSAIWSYPAVVHLSGHGRRLPRREAFRPLLWSGLPVLLTEGASESSWLLKTWQHLGAVEPATPCRLIMRPHHCAEKAIPSGRCSLCAGELAAWLSREHGPTADLTLSVLADRCVMLVDSAVYTAPPGAVVPWPGRRAVGGTVAGHVMIPHAAVLVLTRGTTVDAALEEMLRSGEPALPVGEGSAVAGVVTLADLARSMRDSRGVPSIQRIEALMRPPIEVTMDTPLPEVRAAMAHDDTGLIVVSGPGGGVAGYITASVLLADDTLPGRDVGNRRAGMEVPLLGPGGGTSRICVPV
jgi:CBS domain-containing protein